MTRMRALGAGVAELVDAADSKSASFTRVGVRVPSPVPYFLRKYADFWPPARICPFNLAFSSPKACVVAHVVAPLKS